MKLITLIALISLQLAANKNKTVRDVYDEIKTINGNKSPVEPGIKWTEGLSWQQVVKKAKEENKLIFVDCYATWCKPCKLMDREVYTDDTVGSFMNDKFISIRLQLDTTENDDKNIKLLYSTAKRFQKKYEVRGMPTFLFFSSEGIILHKNMGAKSRRDFVQLAVDARDPAKQIYPRIASWKAGKLNYKMMPSLANDLAIASEADLSCKVAEDYIHRLEMVSEDELLSKENIKFIDTYSFLITSHDRIFSYYQNNSSRIDTILKKKGYSKELIHSIVKREEIEPFVKLAKSNGDSVIKWEKIEATIEKKYSEELCFEVLSDAKLSWYLENDQWKNLISEAIARIDKRGVQNENGYWLNNVAWIIFERSYNKNELEKAVDWMNYIMSNSTKLGEDARLIDTKANLLYKLGKINEAIVLEEQAVSILPENKTVLDKMKKGHPTWPSN
ncbi:thioredoxin family protein [Niastella sp. OAS944]|uniref:thioredoxin family protein n=1 Tax=Niastella sp. OAS944 TaxID=2664089 RepID=UPI0034733A76|nr:thioredoxin-related protein [Chitinophagaceae bacterium OAS944]